VLLAAASHYSRVRGAALGAGLPACWFTLARYAHCRTRRFPLADSGIPPAPACWMHLQGTTSTLVSGCRAALALPNLHRGRAPSATTPAERGFKTLLHSNDVLDAVDLVPARRCFWIHLLYCVRARDLPPPTYQPLRAAALHALPRRRWMTGTATLGKPGFFGSCLLDITSPLGSLRVRSTFCRCCASPAFYLPRFSSSLARLPCAFAAFLRLLVLLKLPLGAETAYVAFLRFTAARFCAGAAGLGSLCCLVSFLAGGLNTASF